MGVVVGIGRCDSREHVLVALARQQVPVVQRGFAKNSEAGIPGRIGNNPRTASNLNDIKHLRSPFSFCPQLWIEHSVEDT